MQSGQDEEHELQVEEGGPESSGLSVGVIGVTFNKWRWRLNIDIQMAITYQAEEKYCNTLVINKTMLLA